MWAYFKLLRLHSIASNKRGFYQNLCRYIPSFVCSGTMVIELREFNDKKKKKKKNNMDNLAKNLVHRLLSTCSVL